MALRQVVEDIDSIAFFIFFGFILVWTEIVGLKQAVYFQGFFLDYFVLAFLLVIAMFFLLQYRKKKF